MNASTFATYSSFDRVAVDRWSAGGVEACMDAVAGEVPVSLEYNGISHAVMLASPSDLEDFAVGFSLSEGIVNHRRQIYDLELTECDEGIQLQIEIASECFALLKNRRRSMAGRTGCGLCGAENLKQVFRPIRPVDAALRLDSQALQKALGQVQAQQTLQQLTGATHAAAWVQGGGQLGCLREDVGRHNALDKLIGALARSGADFGTGIALVTSRASYEMVQKAAAVGIGVVAAISAPTSLAIRTAEALNVTLVGFLRQGGHAIYSHGSTQP